MTQKRFTPTELSTLHNTRFFEVKASATQKIEQLLAEVRDEIKDEIKKNGLTFPNEVDSVNGKIFRGENYRGLPYLVLDYPKHFSKNYVMAFRTMFWWGNFFSFTLHLQGKALELFTPKIQQLKKKKVYLCINNTPWQYHYNKDNYVLLDDLSETEIKKLILEKGFLKLSRKLPLKDHEKLSTFCRETFSLFTSSY